MSLSSIGQEVLDIVGWDTQQQFIGSTDKTARQIAALANQELVHLSKRFTWRQVTVEYSFDTVTGQSEYVLPTDFEKIVDNSVYSKDEYYRLRSSMTEHLWNAWKHGLLGSISHMRFRVTKSGDNSILTLAPTPSSVERLVLFYKSNATAKGEDGALKLKYEEDTDCALLPEDVVKQGLLWRFKSAKGLDYSAELAEYNEMSRTRFAQSLNEGEIPVPSGAVTPEVTDGYVPDSGFGS